MAPQEQEPKHPLPLWARWLLLLFVLLVVLFLALLWIIQGAQAFLPTVIIAALSLMFGFLQLFFQLLPPSLLVPNNKRKALIENSQQVTSSKQAISLETVVAQSPQVLSARVSGSNTQKNFSPSSSPVSRLDWDQAPQSGQFYGRTEEIVKLKQWIVDDRCKVIALLGMGGIGKTCLAVVLSDYVKNDFDYVFWRSLQNAPPLKGILQACIQHISAHQQGTIPEDLDGQLATLVSYLQKHRCLVILDNVESMLEA